MIASRFQFVVLLLLLMMTAISRGQGSTSAEVIQSKRLVLYAEAVPAKAAAGDPVFLSVRLRNISPEAVVLEDSAKELDFVVSVQDRSGYEVPRTAYGAKLIST